MKRYAVAWTDGDSYVIDNPLQLEFVEAISESDAILIILHRIALGEELAMYDLSKEPPDEVAIKLGYEIVAKELS
jgi:hypothetical protein